MSEIKNGGPAFPIGRMDERIPSDGLTLRDYFAAKTEVEPDMSVAYAKAIVGREMPDYSSDAIGNAIFWADFRAKMRYLEADAMLRARGVE